jgi:hypothetical protein
MFDVSLKSRLIGAWQLVNLVVRDMATNAEDRTGCRNDRQMFNRRDCRVGAIRCHAGEHVWNA